MNLPECPDAERSVLGGIIIDPTQLAAIQETLTPNHFYTQKNRIIYQAMLDIDTNNQDPDLITLTEHLRTRDQLDDAGSVPYLLGLMDTTPAAWLAPQHAEIIIQHARRRHLIEYAQKVQSQALITEDADNVITLAEQALADLTNNASGGTPSPATYSEEAASILNEDMGGFIRTGFYSLDRMLGGIKGMCVLGARASSGKSSFSRDIARNVAQRGKRVAILTPDQSGADIYRLETSLRSHVPLDKIKSRSYTLEQAEKWRATLARVTTEYPKLVLVDDRPLTLPSLAARYRNAVRWGATLIIIDYLQLVDVPGLKANEEFASVTATSKIIKRLSRETGVPALALAQLNRGSETRSNPRPIMSDLRSSGQIEQDADSVIFIHRPNKYALDALEPVEFIVEKQKDGPTGIIQLVLRREYATFTEI